MINQVLIHKLNGFVFLWLCTCIKMNPALGIKHFMVAHLFKLPSGTGQMGYSILPLTLQEDIVQALPEEAMFALKE